MKKILFAAIAVFSAMSIYSCGSGETKKAEEEPKFASDNAPKPSAVMVVGESVYKRTCVACHQSSGEGMGTVYPPLAKSDFIADKEKAISQVIHGFSGEMVVNGKTYNNTMPPQQLTDDEIAAVLTYVYGSFGNSGQAVTAEEVKAVRDKK